MVAANHGLSVGLPHPIQLSLQLQTLLHLVFKYLSHNIIAHVHEHICIFFLLLWQLFKAIFYYDGCNMLYLDQ